MEDERREEEEEEGNSSSSSRCWSVATNWTIAHGSLQDSISFESPTYPIEEEGEEEKASRSRENLILQPPPSDSCPCDINVTFTQRHEICQIYVRSTARVYEIYYATEQQGGNEYLCTVRCGIAAREGEILNTGDCEEAIAEVQGSNGKTMEPPQEISHSNSNSSGDEDSWVEVKIPDSPLNGTISPASDISNGNTERKVQDYYEATAEITDSSPCISITLRLLSLQVKECAYIEEIYIFAAPVESTDSSNQAGPSHNSSQSSLLAMLVPSLLQLSKPGQDRIQDKHAHYIRDGQTLQDGGSKATESTGLGMGNTGQQETPSKVADPRVMKMQELNNQTAGHEHLGSGRQIPSVENLPESISREKNDLLERMLVNLDSRMGRMEACFARFEENMLKPLSCMATRLEQLEQKLDSLTMRSEPSRSFHFSRFVAPEFSYGESESNDNTGTTVCSAPESMQKDASLEKPLSPSDSDTALVMLAPELRPCLVVTAPEFLTEDDDNGDKNCDDNSESVRRDHPSNIDKKCDGRSESLRKDHPELSNMEASGIKFEETSESATNDGCTDKPSLSIDDALASALAAFISSASTQSPKHCPSFLVKAPDFPNEDDNSEELLLSPSGRVLQEGSENTNVGCYRNDGTEDSGSTICFPIFQDSEICTEQDMHLPVDIPMEVASSVSSSCEGAVNPNIRTEIQKDSEPSIGNSFPQNSQVLEHHPATADAIVRQNQLHLGGVEDSCKDSSSNGMSAQNWHDTSQTDGSSAEKTAKDAVAVDQHHKDGTESNNLDSSFDETSFSRNMLPTEQTNESSTDTLEGISPGNTNKEWSNDDRGKLTAKGIQLGDQGDNEDKVEENELTQISKPALDFNISILDVKFAPQENWSHGFSLENLLCDDSLERESQGYKVKDNYNDGDATTDQQNHLVQLEVAHSKDSAVINQFLELEEPSMKDIVSCKDGEELAEPSAKGNQFLELEEFSMKDIASCNDSKELAEPSARGNQSMFSSLI